MQIKEFRQLSLSERFVLAFYKGEQISTIEFIDFNASLYVFNNHYVEVYYNTYNDEIESVEILNGNETRLNLYAQMVDITDALTINYN